LQQERDLHAALNRHWLENVVHCHQSMRQARGVRWLLQKCRQDGTTPASAERTTAPALSRTPAD
jgi:hypothetical protein